MKAAVRRLGLLTAGGDCPGLNAVIRGVVARAGELHLEVVGIANGWAGLMEGRSRPLDRDAVRGILSRGGTILGTSRRDPYVHGSGLDSVAPTVAALELDCIVVVGGDGTLRTAARLAAAGLPVVAVPKTIDNDIAGTDVTFGFHTAVQTATDAIDRVTTTAEAHNRVVLVEVMGRTQGWIAIYSGIAAGADVILIPEVPYDLGEVAATIRRRHATGRSYSVVVLAEGIASPGADRTLPVDSYGFTRLGGVAYEVAPLLEAETGFETRVTVLGHVQRGGTPTAFDRVLASRLGVAAADLAGGGANATMVAVRGDAIVGVTLDEDCTATKAVPPALYDVARAFFG